MAYLELVSLEKPILELLSFMIFFEMPLGPISAVELQVQIQIRACSNLKKGR